MRPVHPDASANTHPVSQTDYESQTYNHEQIKEDFNKKKKFTGSFVIPVHGGKIKS
jgi:hypothetical protein